MPLIPPALDDRSYDDIVQEMLANIPAHTPEWTNPQPGDPGRTLIELFAWLADTILYRANLIPERQRIAFLRLLGQTMQPAAAATGLVALSLDPSAVTAVRIAVPATLTGAVNFETLGEIDVLPVTAQAYIKVPLSDKQRTDQMSLLRGLQQLYGLKQLPAGYTTTPVFANGLADLDGLDLMQGTTDQSLWIALLVAKPENLAPVLTALGGAQGQQILSVGFAPAMTVPGLYSVPNEYDAAGTPAPVQATWQMSMPTQSGLPTVYTTLKILGDTTNGLTQPGVVQLMIPQGTQIGAPTNDVRADAQAGMGMKPPRIDDAGIAARLVTWIRLSVTSTLQVSWAGVNAVQIDQRTTYSNIVIGVSDGSANQQFALPQAQVDPTTFVLDVDMPGLGFQTWTATDDLAALQGPTPAYVLDPEAGTVTFGNQLQGMIVPAGRRVRAQTMRAGGGAAGNLPAGSLTQIQAVDTTGAPVTQTLTVQQPLALSGGADSETLASAEQRVPALLRHQSRAVTASDYRNLTEEIPGSGVARVEVLPLFKPQTRTPNVPGVVSVMVIPEKDGTMNPCPRADRSLLQTVYQYLSPRTPVTAEMYVIATEYVSLGLAVAVEVKTGYTLLAVSQAVETALRNYLWPLAPGGPNATGWPLGRHVRSLELEVVVSQVPGVIEISGLDLYQPLNSGEYQQLPVDASGKSMLQLENWQLPEVLQVAVAVGPDGSGIQIPGMNPIVETETAIAVPVVPTVC
jgi:predicted phage baseplate assembly protein